MRCEALHFDLSLGPETTLGNKVHGWHEEVCGPTHGAWFPEPENTGTRVGFTDDTATPPGFADAHPSAKHPAPSADCVPVTACGVGAVAEPLSKRTSDPG